MQSMDSMSLVQAPIELAKLPRPLGASNGRRWYSNVKVIGKRKRDVDEVAVAVDGESCSIHGVSTSGQLAFYAVPPHTTFCCAPLSVLCQIPNRELFRHTYTSLRAEKQYIQRHSESLSRPLESRVESSVTSFDCALDTSDHVVFLGTPSSHTDLSISKVPASVVAISSRGTILCLSGDLKQQIWKRRLTVSTDERTARWRRIEHAQLLDDDRTWTSLLEERPDLFAQLKYAKLSLILVITNNSRKKTHRRQLQAEIWAVPSSVSVVAQSDSLDVVRLILSVPLPFTFSAEATQSHRNPAIWVYGSTLHAYDEGRFYACDILKATKSMESSFDLPATSSKHVYSISSSLIATYSSSALKLYETRYGSLQLAVNISTVVPQASSDEATTLLSLVGVQWRKDIVILLELRSSLFAIRIAERPAAQIPASKPKILLSECIGRGNNRSQKEDVSTTVGTLYTLGVPDYRLVSDTLIHTSPSLDSAFNEAADKCDIQAFEQTFFSMAEECDQDNATSSSSVQSGRRHDAQRNLALLALGKIFDFQAVRTAKDQPEMGKPSSSLAMRFCPQAVIAWIFSLPGMSFRSILGMIFGGSNLSPYSTTQFCQCMIDFDPQTDLIHKMLETPVHFNAEEILQIMTLQVRRLMYSKGAPRRLQLTQNGYTSTDEEMQLTMVDNASRSESDDISNEGALERTLLLAISRAAAASNETLVRGFRAVVDIKGLVEIIEQLRTQLIEDGWFSQCLQSLLSHEINSGESSSLCSILTLVKILTCAIEALYGSLGSAITSYGSINRDGINNLISGLKAEISATLEGIEEATYMGSLFDQLGHFTSVTTSKPVATTNRDISKMSVQSVFIGGKRHLPLDTSTPARLLKSRIDTTGKIRKLSTRKIALARSMQIPKYSFEKILL